MSRTWVLVWAFVILVLPWRIPYASGEHKTDAVNYERIVIKPIRRDQVELKKIGSSFRRLLFAYQLNKDVCIEAGIDNYGHAEISTFKKYRNNWEKTSSEKTSDLAYYPPMFLFRPVNDYGPDVLVKDARLYLISDGSIKKVGLFRVYRENPEICENVPNDEPCEDGDANYNALSVLEIKKMDQHLLMTFGPYGFLRESGNCTDCIFLTWDKNSSDHVRLNLDLMNYKIEVEHF